MRRLTKRLRASYSWLLRAYPPGYRAAFGDEMEAVFVDATRDAASRGLGELARVWFRELRDWPAALARAYWSRLVEMHGALRTQGGIMSATGDRKKEQSWTIDERRRAVLASLPPLVMGLGVAAASTINGRSWFDLTTWQQALLIFFALLPTAILGAGGLVALVRSIPDWGYAWAGGTLVGAVVLLKIVAEERAEVGASIVSPGVDVGIALALVLAGGVVLLIAALRGWAQAGLTSIGFVSTFGITTFSLVRAAPFHRTDLVLLAAPVGLLQALLTYAYVRGERAEPARWLYIVSVWLLNAAPMLLAHRVWRPWLAERGQPSPVIPLLVIVTILAWAGPAAGLLGKPIRRSLNRA